MNFRIVGCSHHESSVALREQLVFAPHQVRPFLDRYHETFPGSEAVLLSTCNRTEFYTASNSGIEMPGQDQVIELIARDRGLESRMIEQEMFVHADDKAIEHLFCVAASLDSMVIGETQILSQVKQAYRVATESKIEMPLTHRVFQNAIRVAKRVANETGIHDKRLSIPSVAIGLLARRIFERFDNKRAVIIGAGDMAGETLNYLKSEGCRDFVVVNRTFETAQQLAAKFAGRAADWQSLVEELSRADLIVSTTGAEQLVVTLGLFDEVAKLRSQRPLFILDLAMPRDIEAGVGDRLNVYLYTLDDLQREVDRNREARKSHWPKARKILQQETAAFMNEMRFRSGGSTISQLKQQADSLKVTEVERLLKRIDGVEGNSLTDSQKREIEHSFGRLVNKILHPPLESLKDDSERGSGLLDALKKLFQLGD